MKTETIRLTELKTECIKALKNTGCDDANADAIAGTVCAAERDHCHSHGVFRMPGYLKSIRNGKAKPDAKPAWSKIAPGVIRGDGDNGFAPLSLKLMGPELAALAKVQGVACLALTNMHHFAAMWPEMEMMTDEGLVAITMTSAFPIVPPPGGKKPLFGTNPFAFGWPRKSGPPMVFDQASAAMARGEVMIAAREGHALPPGVGLDAEGQPTTDPEEVLKGVLLPFGGYKGSAIAMMIELLAAGLIGERFSFEAARHDNKDGGPPRGGEFMLAMDPARFAGEAWLDHTEAFFDKMTSIEGVRLPGTRRHANREKTRTEGVRVPEDLHGKVVGLIQG